ncbi:c-type cytochrome biogenesis protein CcmI [Endozoicomonadaceae bacterium StTr2]
MTEFWIVAALMIIIAAAFVLVPARMYQKRNLADSAAEGVLEDANAAVYRDKLRELETEHAEGRLSADELSEQKQDLVKRLEEELEAEPAGQVKTESKGSLTLPLVMVAILPLFAIGLYFQWGAYDEVTFQQKMQNPQSGQSLPELLAELETVLQKRPDNVQGWYMLGQGYMSAQQFDKAAAAFRKLLDQTGADAEIMSQYAQASLLANDNRMTPVVAEMVERALQLDPDNRTALGIRGIAVFEKGDYREAIRVWQKLLEGTTAQEGRQALLAGIEQARARLKEQGENVDDLPVVSTDKATAGNGIQVYVELGGKLKDLPPQTRVYLFARASGGSKMPLAVMPLTVAQLPLKVELNDTHAMMDGLKVSDYEKFDIVARVSLSGDVMNADYESVVPGYNKTSEQPAQVIIEG